jgi:mycofactocin system glycosyltransferase
VSLRLALDPGARRYAGGRTLLGGDPARVLRLTDAGARELDGLTRGAAPTSEAARSLTRRLLHTGLAHRRDEPRAPDAVTVVIPVRDRPRALDRCLRSARTERPGRIVVVDDGSGEPRSVAAVCATHGAELLRRERPGGPGAARNAALAQTRCELIAFLDSDCIGEPGWLALLCGAMATDARLGAVAPRIRPQTPHPDHVDALARYAAARSPLDLGPHPARVRPGGRVAYLPTAALLVRRAALGAGFDEALRHGEDVDLLWRMHDAGWSLRYEPAAVVRHAEPRTCRGWLARRYRYGTAAGPLARRHPDRLTPVRVHPRPVAVLALAVAGRPRSATAVLGVHVALGTRSLCRLGVPAPAAAGLSLRAFADSAVAVGRAMTMLAPGVAAFGLAHRRTRATTATLLLAEPLRACARSRSRSREPTRPTLDPLRFVTFALADDVAYGTGVWTGALRARTTRPLRPTRTRPSS